MTLEVGTNSYVTVQEADAYFTTRYGSAAWDGLSNEEKEAALVSATTLLDSYCVWLGTPTDPQQPLAFPRAPDTEVPQTIKNAQCEIALSVVESGTPVETNSPALKKLVADTVSLEWPEIAGTTSSIYNSYITTMLNPYCDPTQGGSGCSRVVRT